MSNTEKTSNTWTSFQAYALSVLCLAIGLASGWFIRGSQAPAAVTATSASAASAEEGMGVGQPTTEQLHRMADDLHSD